MELDLGCADDTGRARPRQCRQTRLVSIPPAGSPAPRVLRRFCSSAIQVVIKVRRAHGFLPLSIALLLPGWCMICSVSWFTRMVDTAVFLRILAFLVFSRCSPSSLFLCDTLYGQNPAADSRSEAARSIEPPRANETNSSVDLDIFILGDQTTQFSKRLQLLP